MRVSTKARISAARVSASSLTPASNTVWLTIGMPASTIRAQAARAAGLSSRGWLGFRVPEVVWRQLRMDATRAGVVAVGYETGAQVWKRTIFTHSISAMRAI